MRGRDQRTGLPPWAVVLLLVIFGLLVCVRMPTVALEGRFWAEEGQHFFENAWVMAPQQALLAPFGGYLNLVANAAALAARWCVPLCDAPFVTVAVGLLFQLCPPLLLLTARDAWLRPALVRAAALLLLLLVPASEEIWLQTLHCQFELLLCCAITLALETETGWRVWLRLGLLALAPLCGPVATALIPLFVARAALDRSVPRTIEAATLSAAALVQMLLFFHAVPGRGYILHPVLMLCAFTIRHLALPFLGVGNANDAAAAIRASLRASHLPVVAIVLPLLVFASLLAASVRQRGACPAIWFAVAAVLLAVVSYVGALGGVASLLTDVRGQGRYVVVPQSLFYLAVLALAATTGGWAGRVGWAIVVWLLSVGAYGFVHPSVATVDGPDWRREVALWQADPSHVIRLWPSGWTMTLDRPRPPPG